MSSCENSGGFNSRLVHCNQELGNGTTENLKIHITFDDGKNEKKVSIDTLTGCAAEIRGTLFPYELKVVLGIVELLRTNKDHYQAKRIKGERNDKEDECLK